MNRWLRRLAWRDESEGALGRHAGLLASLVLLLVALPFGQMVAGGKPRFAILLALVLLAATLVNMRQRGLFAWTAVASAAALVGLLTAEILGHDALRIAALSLALGLFGLTTLVMLNALVHSRQVSADTLVGGSCVYLMLGLCFAIAFMLLTEVAPGSLEAGGVALQRSLDDPSYHATKLLYFSFVTLTTLGYGDVVPVSEAAQMFSASEAIVGQLYLAIFVARLVGLTIRARHPHDPGGPPPRT